MLISYIDPINLPGVWNPVLQSHCSLIEPNFSFDTCFCLIFFSIPITLILVWGLISLGLYCPVIPPARFSYHHTFQSLESKPRRGVQNRSVQVFFRLLFHHTLSPDRSSLGLTSSKWELAQVSWFTGSHWLPLRWQTPVEHFPLIHITFFSGSVCTTRKKTGVGYPQLSAVMECADAAHGLKGHIISVRPKGRVG